MKFNNLFKPTPARVKKWMLALKGLIGTISVSAIVQDKPYLATGFLVAGAFIDFAVDAIFSEEEVKS